MAPSLSIGASEREVLEFLSKWWITVAVMASLLMQLLLLLTGGTRKWSTIARFVAWNAYTWSDFIATSALGSLAQSAVANTHQEVYALWAPMLLLHLGAPDNISAYALADAELWQRHGINMLLQIAIVVYVVANCVRSWKYVLLSICLTALGSIKYAERTLALKRASRADVIDSALPIYQYMLAEADLDLDTKGPDADGTVSSSPNLSASRTLHPNPSYYFIIRGEKQWLQSFLKAGKTNYIKTFQDAARTTPELVTLQDVLLSQQLRQEAPSAVLICAGFALFKLYKRRLSNLYMYEWREEKIYELFAQRHVFEDEQKIMFVLDVELRFLFDSLYTKAAGTAFSKLGVAFRLLATTLLVVSGFVIFTALSFQDQAVEQARNVTFGLIVAAVIIEAYQLARLALSDWTRVWLVCIYIDVGEKLKKGSSWSLSRRLRSSLLSIILGLIKFSSRVGRHSYWRSSIGQYVMLDVDQRPSTWRCMNKKLAQLVRQDWLQLLPEYVYDKQLIETFKNYVLTKSLASCGGIDRTPQLLDPCWFLSKYDDRQEQLSILQAAVGGVDDSYYGTDLEHLVVSWHVATCVCELLAVTPVTQHLEAVAEDSQSAEVRHVSSDTYPDAVAEDSQCAEIRHVSSDTYDCDALSASPVDDSAAGTIDNLDLQMSKLLSRYVMYLLVHKTELLPCHADIARKLAVDTEKDICALTWNTEFITMLLNRSKEQNNPDETTNTPSLPFNLMNGIQAGSLLQALPRDVRWRLVADVWVDILVACASGNKPIEQIQQLTLGGEFITHLWVLLGHMGYGSQ